MAAYRGMSRRIKDGLIAILQAVQLDMGAGSAPAFASVIGSNQGEFDSYPSVRVLPGDLTTTKGSVSENDKTVDFVVRVHLRAEESGKPEAAVIDDMYDLTDLIIDTFDSGDYTGALNAYDSTLGTWIMNATRGNWSVDGSSIGVVIMCDVNVSISYSRDL